jgi:hypothetical protein
MISRSDRLVAAHLRRELGRLEDHGAASGWGWAAELSLRVETRSA